MATRKIGISEARRLLPELVKTIGKDGGRIDITYRGEPRVTLLRVSDVKREKGLRAGAGNLPAALQVTLSIPAKELMDAIRELRSRQGWPRSDWFSTGAPRRRKKPPKRTAQR